MSSNKSIIIVGEHERVDKNRLGGAFFNELCDFAKDEQNDVFLKFASRDALKTTQYVGVVQTQSGALEILPKTYKGKLRDESEAKGLLLRMLKTLKDSPFKNLDASLETARLPIFEIFARAFCDELDNLIKRGIRSKYIATEQNRRYLKGRLLHAQNLRQNLIHKERFYTQSDEYIRNIAQNRLIKSALMLLQRQDFGTDTHAKILEQRYIFDDIPHSRDVKRDFLECEKGRDFSHYGLLLGWCRVFLSGLSFSPYSGDSKSFALLFDMNKLFESFVAHELRKCGEFEILTQESKRVFSDFARYTMRPDILVFSGKKCVAVLDTKWKVIDGREKDIETSDIFQVFGYGARFCNDEKIKVILVYPKIDGATQTPLNLTFKADENINFSTYFWDVENDDSALESSLLTITTQAPNYA